MFALCSAFNTTRDLIYLPPIMTRQSTSLRVSHSQDRGCFIAGILEQTEEHTTEGRPIALVGRIEKAFRYIQLSFSPLPRQDTTRDRRVSLHQWL